MGLTINGTKFLMYAKTLGVCFARTAMIGRQGLHLGAEDLKNNLSAFGYSLAENEVNALLSKADGFAEPFLQTLGASEVCSFDASAFEGVSDIHDFNFPIDEKFRNRFTAVLDGGTLEHIFNFPVAIENCMEMLEVGGHFLSITPTNNFWGHGMYQFGPELFYRVFCEANGFKIVRLMIFEDRPEADWFEVRDPEAVKERPSHSNASSTNLLVLAKKTAAVEIFAAPPQQSDYVALWDSNGTGVARDTSTGPPLLDGRPRNGRLLPSAARKLYRFAPPTIKQLYRSFYWARHSAQNSLHNEPFGNPKFFRRIQVPAESGLAKGEG